MEPVEERNSANANCKVIVHRSAKVLSRRSWLPHFLLSSKALIPSAFSFRRDTRLSSLVSAKAGLLRRFLFVQRRELWFL